MQESDCFIRLVARWTCAQNIACVKVTVPIQSLKIHAERCLAPYNASRILDVACDVDGASLSGYNQ
jgi:hypothetical protein